MTDKKRTVPETPAIGQPDWESLRYCLALARLGSLSAVARALRVNHATVSRRVASVEESLGRVLFDRRADGYGLTEDGRVVLAEAEAMETAVHALRDRLELGAAPRGVVCLTTIWSLADHFLADRLGPFAEAHPGIDLEILTDARIMSLNRREADIALRLGRPEDSDLRARKVADVAYRFYAAPGYKARGEDAALIGYDEDSDFVAEAAWMHQHLAGRRFRVRSNGHTTQAAAARAGLGVALLPCYLGDPDPGLIRVDHGPPPPRELWLLTPADRLRIPRVREVFDALAGLIGREAGLFSGTSGPGTTP